MPKVVFLVPLLLSAVATVALWVGGPLLWMLPVVAFVLVPLGDQLIPASERNADPATEQALLSDRFYDLCLLAIVPLQVLNLGSFLWHISHGTYAGVQLLGAFLTAGISCGGFAINIAHELGHRREELHQRASLVLLATTLYMHFFIEHNRGHHRHVATPDDPASSRRGETVYAFWPRSIVGSWRHAWELENDRVIRKGLNWWNWDNAMMRYSAIQLGLVAAVGVLGGAATVAAWMVVSVMGWLLLETINYIEHYGLSRSKTERGSYERVQPAHSWNTNRMLGRVFLFELTRHSDHHAHATRPFQVLRHHDHAPQLPAGYPALILLSLVPPVFMKVMGQALDDWHQVDDAA